MGANRATATAGVLSAAKPGEALDRPLELALAALGALDRDGAEALLVACADRMTVDQLRQIGRRFFTPQALRTRQTALVDDLYRRAAGFFPELTTSRAIAEALHAALARYAASCWRFDRGRPAPADPRLAAFHAILAASGAEVRSARTIRRVLAGVAANSGGNGQRPLRGSGDDGGLR